MNILEKLAIVIVLVFFPVVSYGAVSGPCGTCHTMHNSQNNTAQAMFGSEMGWSGDDGSLTGGSLTATPQPTLLVTNCVGCHSSTSTDTIIDIGGAGGNRIPIVYNTGGYPSNALAGGNFFYVGDGDDSKGHNVYGIAEADVALVNGAPGLNTSGCIGGSNVNSCHMSLARAPTFGAGGNFGLGGCQGCHLYPAHHDDNPVLGYRFLSGHNSDTDYVRGDEDDDWEFSKSSTDHNFYEGEDGPVSGTLSSNQSMSAFCGGCHIEFHRANNITSGSAWVRHPVDTALPTTGVFSEYNPVTSYDADVPVAWTASTNTGDRGTAVVMCLTCHRAHGSPYDDMLRWDYNTDCSTGVANADCGCFKCHTDKD